MNKVLNKLFLSVLLAISGVSNAATPAGTVISNQATLEFIQEGISSSIVSNIANFFVHEILDVSVVLSSSNPITVGSPDNRKYSSFLVTNTGNGTQSFRFSASNNLSGDDFNPIFLNNQIIYIENGLAPDLQLTGVNADILYVNQNLSILADESKVIYLVADIPSGLSINNRGLVSLDITSSLPNSQSFTVGQVIPGQGAASTDIVVGPSLGRGQAVSEFRVSNLIINMNKSVINEPTNPKTGDILRYRVNIDLSGNGFANNITITDPVPTGLTYINNSTTLNSVAQTDAVDSDAMSFIGNTIRVTIPSINNSSNIVLEYSLSIN